MSIHPSIHPDCLSVSVSFHLTARLLKHTTFSHSTDSLIEPGHLHTQSTLEPLFCALSVSDCPSVPQSNNLSIYLSVRPSVHLSIHPSLLLSICLYIFSFDRPLVKAHYFFTDSLIGPGHLHRKNILSLHFVFCLCLSIHLAVNQSINQSINQSVRPSAMSVCSYVGLTVHPSSHPSIHL